MQGAFQHEWNRFPLQPLTAGMRCGSRFAAERLQRLGYQRFVADTAELPTVHHEAGDRWLSRRTLQPLCSTQLGAATTWIFGNLLFTGSDRVLVDEAEGCLICAGAHRNAWRADAASCSGGECLLHNAIFKGVIRKNDNASANAQGGDRCRECRAQGGKLIVHSDAQRLKDPRCWVNARWRAVALRHTLLNECGKLLCCRDW